MAMMESMVKVFDGSNCWKMKSVERRKSIKESLLEMVFGWMYVVSREEKRRLSCDFSFEL